jgi:hypothetical protein
MNDYHSFFELFESAPNLGQRMLSNLAHRIRYRSLLTISKSYYFFRISSSYVFKVISIFQQNLYVKNSAFKPCSNAWSTLLNLESN